MYKFNITIIFLLFFQIVFSQKKEFEKVSIDQFVSETQYSSDTTDSVDLIWWIPTEYWNVVFAADNTVSKVESDAIVNMMKDYVVIISVKGKVGLFGGITYETKDVLESVSKVAYLGENLNLVDETRVNADLLNFLSMIKPMMKNMLGAMGENMQVFLFENPKGKSVLPIDPYGDGTVLFEMGEFKESVQLPLGCLLEEKLCPIDKIEHSGKWNYCPYHGEKLVLK